MTWMYRLSYLSRSEVAALMLALVGLAFTPSDAHASDRLLVVIVSEDDANGDGRLSRDEAPVEILASFDAADADHDGAIDDFEARRFDARRIDGPRIRPPNRAAGGLAHMRDKGTVNAPGTAIGMIERLDLDGDGQVSREEFPAEHRESFDSLDLDKSGYIDRRDAETIDTRRERIDTLIEERGVAGERTVPRVVQLMDTNGDGLLQKREAPLNLQRIWDSYDRNGDGAIDMREALSPAPDTGS
jgi:Ca2+-binding EF-hand superfamily protein